MSELCNRCNLQRQSFYYHFQDKYDLVAWIFMQDTSRVFAEGGSQLILQFISSVLNTFYDKKEFYVRIMADRSQNLPLLYIQDYVYRFCLTVTGSAITPMSSRQRSSSWFTAAWAWSGSGSATSASLRPTIWQSGCLR